MVHLILSTSLFVLIGLAVLCKTLVRVSSDEVALIYRLGQFSRIAYPGITFAAPFIDYVIKRRVKGAIAEWEQLPQRELRQKFEERFVTSEVRAQLNRIESQFKSQAK